MKSSVVSFLRDDAGVVSVDWTVLSAATVAMSLATVGLLNGGLQGLISRLDGELRSQQMSDSFVEFTSAHFEPLYEGNHINAAAAEELFTLANSMMNQELIDALQYGIQAIEAGETFTPEEIAQLMAIASVAHQRNLLPDSVMNHYFGFDGEPGVISSLL
jgi:Flp pilus assembly pilin Flp